MTSGRDLSLFADGLREWLTTTNTEEISTDAEAAGLALAESVLLLRKWVIAQFKKS